MQVELRRELDEEQTRKTKREADHQARLLRIERYKNMRLRAVKAKELKKQEAPPEEEVPLVIRKPKAPRPSSDARAASRAALARAKLKRQAEIRSQEQLDARQEQEKEQVKSDNHQKALEAHRIGKARLDKWSQADRDRKKTCETEESQRREEVLLKDGQAKEVALRRAKDRVRSSASRRKQEDEIAATRNQAMVQAKKQRQAAAEIEVLPRMRALAGRRARQLIHLKHMEQDMLLLRKQRQERTREENKRQYSHPSAIIELKQNAAISADQGKIANEVAHNVVGEAVASVSTDYCSTGDLWVQFDDDDRPAFSSARHVQEVVPATNDGLDGATEALPVLEVTCEVAQDVEAERLPPIQVQQVLGRATPRDEGADAKAAIESALLGADSEQLKRYAQLVVAADVRASLPAIGTTEQLPALDGHLAGASEAAVVLPALEGIQKAGGDTNTAPQGVEHAFVTEDDDEGA